MSTPITKKSMKRRRTPWLSEREAWEAILDVLVGYGMPPARHAENGVASGLCAAAFMVEADGLITGVTYARMCDRIESVMPASSCPAGFLVEKYKAAPRIKWVEKFINECAT